MRLIPEGTAKQSHLNTLALRLAVLIATITTSVAAIGQANEYRAYYLDVTASMEDNGIWQPVKETLKEAIKKITDETTTLEIVAWTDDNHKNGPSLKRKADENGKRELCKFIDELQTVSNCHTDVYVPFEDFCSKHAQDKGETYFFLMTDGNGVKNHSLIYRGTEKIKIRNNGTKYRCLKLSFVEKRNNKEKEVITFYVSDDSNHIPVRLDMNLNFGSAKAFLTNHSGLKNPMKAQY